ncbi:MAG: alanine--tRNA ligase [Defluviitaleaceae bacterium]|nr:alanine--tRNA ligase [Defluviitaleaceae bacterium]
MKVNDIREKFLKFFEGKEHLRLPSYSLVPDGDKSLLLINAGMAPMKPFFMGQATPPSKRVTTSQKCVRTGDIDEVGKTARHGTFFEMLGNFSFADYFKKESIHWAWEFLTGELKIPADKLWVTVYLDDDEAHEIWEKEVGVAPERINRLGKDDNFWELSVGPCGPCSEIFYDRGAEFGKDDFLASNEAGEDRYLEIWNLVFIQFNKDEEGNYGDLPAKGIDTGMGMERISMLMQGATSIFDIDTMRAIREEVCRLAGYEYGGKFGDKAGLDTSVHIVTDHTRSLAFLLADGVMPSGEGRGYVLRRLLRRAARHGKLLGIEGLFLAKLAQVAINVYKDAYPELAERQDHILKIITNEESRFYDTLDSGMALLKSKIAEIKAGGVLAGADAFKLHDTYGFPLELTREILEEQGIGLDEAGFHAEMEAQKARARSAREDAGYTGGDSSAFEGLSLAPVDFVGYDDLFATANIQHIIPQGENVLIVADKTPFYAESGGQKGDTGTIETDTGAAEVIGCVKIENGQFAHIAKIISGEITQGQVAKLAVDEERRMDTMRHHTATHLLHMALSKVLGKTATQAGASKGHDGLRFDFNHHAALTKEEISQLEDIVNDGILRNIPVVIEEMGMEAAKARGAMALFGEKYGNVVRVVDIGGESVELCGGTHLTSTGGIGAFKIVSEGGIAAGVRRIEAVVGKYALAYFRQTEEKLAEAAAILKTPTANLIKRVEQLIAANKEAEGQLTALKAKLAQDATGDILSAGEEIGDVTVYTATLEGVDMDGLRNLSDDLISKMSDGVLILAGVAEGKGNLLIRATESAVSKGVHCGNMVKAGATAAGGGGGGRPNMAQAGIKDIGKMDDAIAAAKGVAG